MCNGLAWSASAQGKHTDEAWQLIEYLGSKEAQQKQAELGVTMSAFEGTSDGWVKSYAELGYDMQPYLDMRENAVYIRILKIHRHGIRKSFRKW